ncbi:MAG: DNA-directed RNA polymerase [Fusobacteriaceae bacterium]
MNDETLYSQQIKIEEASRFDVQAKEQCQIDKYVKSESEYNTNYGKKAIKQIIPLLMMYLTQLATIKKNKWGFLIKFLRPRMQFEIDTEFEGKGIIQSIAEMTAVNVVASMSTDTSFTGLCRTISDAFHRTYDIPLDEMGGEEALKFDKFTMTFFKALIHKIEVGYEEGEWNEEDGKMPEPVIEIRQDEDSSQYFIKLQPEWLMIIKESNRNTLLNVSSHTLMVVPPNRHKSLLDKNGGYLTENSQLLRDPTRVNGKIDESIRAYTDETNPEFFEEINRIQETGFVINKPLLSLLKGYYERGLFFTKYPIKKEQTLAIHEEAAAKEIKEWEKARHAKSLREEDYEYVPLGQRQINKVKHTHKMECLETVRKTNDIFDKAEDFKGFAGLYFAVYVDDRMRRYTYVHSGSLTYMGGSLAKALLNLKDKEAFDIVGIRHLFMTLANCLGYDKESLSMKLPKAIQFWTDNRDDFFNDNYDIFFEKQDEMEDAIQGIAVCLEMVQHERAAARGEVYLSGILCHKDARCSGAAIIGTMLQDRNATTLTSVVDIVMDKAERLPDAYLYTAKTGKEMNTNQYFKDNSEILFSRTTWKNPTMTRSSYGCSESTIHSGADKGKVGGNMKLFKDNNLDFEQCTDFTKLMMKALDKSLPGNSLYLKSIKAASKEVLLTNGVWKYKNPITGFPVVRRKVKIKEQRLSTPKGYSRVDLVFYTPTNTLDLNESLQAVAPDLVHNIDASLLIMVGQDLKVPMATVHDSIATHPNHGDKLVASYANALHYVATKNVLGDIYESLGTSIKAPFVGSLSDEELESIKHSMHCLA